MIRLIVVALAALYAIMQIFGDPSRRPEVARSEPLGLSLVQAAYLPDEPIKTVSLPVTTISDDVAIQMALEAGATLRSERKRAPLRGDVNFVAAHKKPVAEATSEAAAYWYVTGSRVNIRSGPGTSNAVVGQVTFGVEAEVLGDKRGWFQIRTADGEASGWIYGKFLGEKRPG